MISFFARHEARLAWRDFVSLMTAGGRRGPRMAIIGLLAYLTFMHGLGWAMITGTSGDRLVVSVTFCLILGFSLMVSQAMDSVTRAFHTRGDLELILTSPADVARLAGVRIAAMAVGVTGIALSLAGPFIDVLAWRGGYRFLAGYPAAAALAMAAVAVSVVITAGLFRIAGPARTRVIAQVVSAVIGAGFAIFIQFAAVLSFGSFPGTLVARVDIFARFSPNGGVFWWPARAVLGDWVALVAILTVGVGLLAIAIGLCAPRFGPIVLATGSVTRTTARTGRPAAAFSATSPARALRRKEWVLLLRDPWLISQTLMQLLYLLPAAFILWRTFHGGAVSSLLVPVLIVAAGQLGGGLAWLAVSGEDAPDLIASAPVTSGQVLMAKTMAVLGGIAVVFSPFVLALAISAPLAAPVAAAGVTISAGSATAIQFWFRTQARRSQFRRRQTSSRVATIAEAASSTLWAGTGALAAAGTWFAWVSGGLVILLLLCTWAISPGNADRSLRARQAS